MLVLLQIVKFKSLSYSANVFISDDAYETVLTKVSSVTYVEVVLCYMVIIFNH